jgi:hypothetical protein
MLRKSMALGPAPETGIPLGSSGLAVAPLGWGMWRLARVHRVNTRMLKALG